MRKLSLITALIICSAMLFSVNAVQADDEGWATVGKILTGVVGGEIIYNIFTDSDCRRPYYPSGHYFSYGYYGPGMSIQFNSDGYGYYPRGYYRYPRYCYRRPYYPRRRHRHHRRHFSRCR